MDEQLDDEESIAVITQLKSMYPADKYSLYSTDTEEKVSFSCMVVLKQLRYSRFSSHVTPQCIPMGLVKSPYTFGG